VVEANKRLTGGDTIAEIREDPADFAVGLRRNRDLIDRGERADDFKRPVDRFLSDRLGLHLLDRAFAAAGLRRRGFGAAGGRTRAEGGDDRRPEHRTGHYWVHGNATVGIQKT